MKRKCFQRHLYRHTKRTYYFDIVLSFGNKFLIRWYKFLFTELEKSQFEEEENMKLYHGSNIGDIKVLEPRQADHDRPYVYMTTIDVVIVK